MRTQKIGTIAGAVYLVMSVAAGATADPVSVSGYYSTLPYGGSSTSELTLTFPGFAVNIFENDAPNALDLVPGFRVENGSAITFTQSTSTFSLHSLASPAMGTVEADVTGHLSFVGPTDIVDVPSDCGGQFGCGQVLTESITWSGFVTIQQGDHRFFSGSLHGSGSATAVYETFPPSQFWQGTEYRLSGAAETPEPGSLVLLGSGVVCLVSRRRHRARAASPIRLSCSPK